MELAGRQGRLSGGSVESRAGPGDLVGEVDPADDEIHLPAGGGVGAHASHGNAHLGDGRSIARLRIGLQAMKGRMRRRCDLWEAQPG